MFGYYRIVRSCLEHFKCFLRHHPDGSLMAWWLLWLEWINFYLILCSFFTWKWEAEGSYDGPRSTCKSQHYKKYNIESNFLTVIPDRLDWTDAVFSISVYQDSFRLVLFSRGRSPLTSQNPRCLSMPRVWAKKKGGPWRFLENLLWDNALAVAWWVTLRKAKEFVWQLIIC